MRFICQLVAVAAFAGLVGLIDAAPAAAAPSCPGCGRELAEGFRFCPYDGAALPAACPRCARAMESAWSFCPFDGTPLAGGVPAPAPSPAPSPSAAAPAPAAEPAPATPTPGAAPTPAASSTSALPPAAAQPGEAQSNPLAVVDALFRAIEVGDRARIRQLYRWSAFFASPAEQARAAAAGAAPSGDLDAEIDRYIEHVLAEVRPMLEGRKRVPVRVKLGQQTASIGIGLQDSVRREIVFTYDFSLANDGHGWKIIAIAP